MTRGSPTQPNLCEPWLTPARAWAHGPDLKWKPGGPGVVTVGPSESLVNAFARLESPAGLADFAMIYGVPRLADPISSRGVATVPAAPILAAASQVAAVMRLTWHVLEGEFDSIADASAAVADDLRTVGINDTAEVRLAVPIPGTDPPIPRGHPEHAGSDAAWLPDSDGDADELGEVLSAVGDGVGRKLDQWEREWGVRSSTNGRFARAVVVTSCLGGVVLQLRHSFAQRNLARCYECKWPYLTVRRPPHKSDQRNYCDSCRQAGIPHRDAERDRRARSVSITQGGR